MACKVALVRESGHKRAAYLCEFARNRDPTNTARKWLIIRVSAVSGRGQGFARYVTPLHSKFSE